MNSQEAQEAEIRKSIVVAALERVGPVHKPCTVQELYDDLDMADVMAVSEFEHTMASLVTTRKYRAPIAQFESATQPKKYLFVEPVRRSEALLS